MLKSEKITGQVVFLSDLHLGHNREFLWGKRGFNSVEEHDNFIEEQWFELIDEQTTVINLGDSHFGDPTGEKFRNFCNWTCKKQYFLWGNHISGAKQVFHSETMGLEIYPTTVGNLTFVGFDASFWINGKNYQCSHFPKRIWDNMARGARCLSGHSHGNDSGRNIGNDFGKCLDIGVENAMGFSGKFFFTFDEVEQLLNKETKILDHHG